MSANLTRRAIIGGAGVALAAITAIESKAAVLPAATSEIERHWLARCQAYRDFETDPLTLVEPVREKAYWAIIDAAETGILNNADTSCRAAEIRLWVGWSAVSHMNTAEGDLAVNVGDVATLMRMRDDLDWPGKLIFAAILNLRGEG